MKWLLIQYKILPVIQKYQQSEFKGEFSSESEVS